MEHIEQTLDSREVAEMIEKEHSKLLRDIYRYEEQFREANIGFTDFFKKSQYTTGQNKILPCYKITKKGCEFIAHKLTGTKGTIFTARYVNRFHEMQDILQGQQEQALPWFIRKFRGNYIVLERDFIQITGVDITKHKRFYNEEDFTGGLDWNGYAWYTTIDREKFRQEHGFDYGDDKCMFYLYPSGVRKALNILEHDRKIHMKPDAKTIILNGLRAIQKQKNEIVQREHTQLGTPAEMKRDILPIQINITLGSGLRAV